MESLPCSMPIKLSAKMTLAIVCPKKAFAIKDNDYSFKTPNIHVFLLGKVKIYSYQTYTNTDYPYIKPSYLYP